MWRYLSGWESHLIYLNIFTCAHTSAYGLNGVKYHLQFKSQSAAVNEDDSSLHVRERNDLNEGDELEKEQELEQVEKET